MNDAPPEFVEDACKRATRKLGKAPAFVLRAERAMRRVAQNVRTQNRALNLPLIVWQDGKMVEKPA